MSDRSKPPPGYEVTDLDNWWMWLAEGSDPDVETEPEAIAACWAHRDAITKHIDNACKVVLGTCDPIAIGPAADEIRRGVRRLVIEECARAVCAGCRAGEPMNWANGHRDGEVCPAAPLWRMLEEKNG